MGAHDAQEQEVKLVIEWCRGVNDNSLAIINKFEVIFASGVADSRQSVIAEIIAL